MPYGNPPAAETDGLIGCAQLAPGLHRVGITVIIVTDSMCFHSVKVAVFAAGVPANVPFDIVPVADNSIDATNVVTSRFANASIFNLWESL
nr:glutamate cyclase domain-containing protein [Tolypothrix sp. NIES-4075]